MKGHQSPGQKQHKWNRCPQIHNPREGHVNHVRCQPGETAAELGEPEKPVTVAGWVWPSWGLKGGAWEDSRVAEGVVPAELDPLMSPC